ncbi:MAG: hypothetical protein BWY76_03133 [bacterium ADurb.Bin429]|nr:MAG: hypothetical protein BWY76_03133 [bacterium ADurb.Bin429]
MRVSTPSSAHMRMSMSPLASSPMTVMYSTGMPSFTSARPVFVVAPPARYCVSRTMDRLSRVGNGAVPYKNRSRQDTPEQTMPRRMNGLLVRDYTSNSCFRAVFLPSAR